MPAAEDFTKAVSDKLTQQAEKLGDTIALFKWLKELGPDDSGRHFDFEMFYSQPHDKLLALGWLSISEQGNQKRAPHIAAGFAFDRPGDDLSIYIGYATMNRTPSAKIDELLTNQEETGEKYIAAAWSGKTNNVGSFIKRFANDFLYGHPVFRQIEQNVAQNLIKSTQPKPLI